MNAFPAMNYATGTQKFHAYDLLKNRGEVCGRDFLKAGILEYRSRCNEIKRDLNRFGFTIRTRREPGTRFVYFRVAPVQGSLFEGAA